MNCPRGFTTAMVIACLVASGCESSDPGTTVSVYRPQLPVMETRAPDSGVFVLWQNQGMAPPAESVNPGKKKIRHANFHVEVEQVYVQRGSPIGFAMQRGQLIGVAGATSMPLQQAHYNWQPLAGSSDRDINRRNTATVIVAVIAVVAVAGILFAVFHVNRHHDLIDPVLSDLCTD